MWDEIAYPFSNFNGVTVEICKGEVISSHILLGMWLLIHAASNGAPCFDVPYINEQLYSKYTVPRK